MLLLNRRGIAEKSPEARPRTFLPLLEEEFPPWEGSELNMHTSASCSSDDPRRRRLSLFYLPIQVLSDALCFTVA